jgi:hypothetical protein
MAALQMHQPATAELIRKTDEQTDALLRQKKLLQATACSHPPALHGALASAGPAIPMDACVRINQSRCTGWRTRHRVGYQALSAALGCATGAVANLTLATYGHS